ncbi:type ISP restriction/modification enzyme [Streptomyces sp. T028]|uniref:type ISP restriction/modification enzyme n=1 Tax=Streptomyces sp. T028 TaxID=3394379 RepID=UPI003A84A2C2
MTNSEATAGSTPVVQAVAAFGASVKAKFAVPTAKGSPEDQLRAPFEALVKAMANACGLNPGQVVLVGENTLQDLATRPDYAVTYSNALVGYIELKAPGKGADPRRFTDGHDKNQGKKLRSLPNVMFSDGNSFSLWQNGNIVGRVEILDGDVETSGSALKPGPGLLRLFAEFLQWVPLPPRTPKQLAETSARLCRLMRDEVGEQLALGAPALVDLAVDWRHLLFPQATNDEFADGYAQAVTFGLLLARAREISFENGIDFVARELGTTNSLIGRAVSILTDTAVSEGTLATSVRTLMRVLSVVDWPTLSNGDPEVWLYFYEHFLAEYDSALRRRTGSYYTPPPVVESMTRWTDEVLSTFLGRSAGLADESVTLVDPAMGTGTFLLAVLRKIADRIAEDQGEGAVGPVLEESLKRIIGFEIQLGPYAVAQLRLLAELAELGAGSRPKDLRTYVTDTLSNPYVEDNLLGAWYEPIAVSRRQANKVKKDEEVVVVLGNPPYKEKARGRGGWIEAGSDDTGPAKLKSYMPPTHWNVGNHAKHLYNLYVYFWRWATWKVFEQRSENSEGVICYITVAGFLDGDGFQMMRASLRRQADRIWVVDCSPEGHQPAVNTRIFQAVQHPVCIVVAVRDGSTDAETPAEVLWASLPEGHRDTKFEALKSISLVGGNWAPVSDDWRAPFTPIAEQAWANYASLDDIFAYSASGMMPGRTWVYAPDVGTLRNRWDLLIGTSDVQRKRNMLSEHEDRTLETVLKSGLPGYPMPRTPIGRESGSMPDAIRIGYRSFDRQWIIPDKRLINRPNPTLWSIQSDSQVYLTVLNRSSPTNGPAVTFTALIPDQDHYKGHGSGRAYPLWGDSAAETPNISLDFLAHLATVYSREIFPEEVFAYLACVAAHPGYVSHFRQYLREPGIRIPLTADVETFDEAVQLGKRIIWLHTYGQRFVDPAAGRPASAPRVSSGNNPRVMRENPIPSNPEEMPDRIDYDDLRKELIVGEGRICNVPKRVKDYEISGVNVLDKWFSYRRRNRERPVIGNRKISELAVEQADRWLPEYTADLIDLLNVLCLLVEHEEEQNRILEQIISGSQVNIGDVPRNRPEGRQGRNRGRGEMEGEIALF